MVEAAAYLVAHMPLDKRKAVIAGILGFITQPLQSALEQNNEEAVVLMADRLTVVFRCVTSTLVMRPLLTFSPQSSCCTEQVACAGTA